MNAELPTRACEGADPLNPAPIKPDPDANLASLIIDALEVGVRGEIASRFERYLRSYVTDRWLIFSDYVLGQRNRPNDVFAFTLLPGGQYLSPLMHACQANAKRDFKDIRDVSEPMMDLLRDPRLFTFCFIIDPSRRITQNAAAVRGMFDRSIERLSGKPDRALREREIKALRAMRSKAASPGFNVCLFDNILLGATFAAFLTVLISRTCRVSRAAWFSDRDSIVSSYKAFAYFLYAQNVAVLSHRHSPGSSGPSLGVNAPVEEGGTLWCDALLRVPDHFAGMVSAWNFVQDTIPETLKYRQVLQNGIADNSNVSLMRLIVKRNDNLISAYSQSIAVVRK